MTSDLKKTLLNNKLFLPGDEEVRFTVGRNPHGNIIVDFGRDVKCIVLTPESALQAGRDHREGGEEAMSCTEAEAKMRWCPFYRVATSGGDEGTYEIDNRPIHNENMTPEETNPNKVKWVSTGMPEQHSCCIGSHCMAWQWSSSPYQCMELDLGDKPADGDWSQIHGNERCRNCGMKCTNGMLHYYRKVDVRSGFCGLTAREGRFSR